MKNQLVDTVAKQLSDGWFHQAKEVLEHVTPDPDQSAITIEWLVGAFLPGIQDQMPASFMEALEVELRRMVEETWSTHWSFEFLDVAWSFGSGRCFILRVIAKRRSVVVRRSRRNPT